MEESQLPPGFRFHPTDEELITCYLSPKVLDFRFVAKAITDVDLNKCEPWDLPAKASMGEKEWYFFSLSDRKYPTGLRTNRATDAGYWKTTGKDKEIFRSNVTVIGTKKTLVFYRGRAPKGEKTNWVMHEYRKLPDKFPPNYKPSATGEWVVCRVFKKSSNEKKPQPNGTAPSMPDSPCDTTSGTELGVVDASSSLSIMNRSLANGTPVAGSFNSMISNNLHMNWMLPWLGSSSSFSTSRSSLPFDGYQAMETANMWSLHYSGGLGEYHPKYGSESKSVVDSVSHHQQQQQHEHEPMIWRRY